jgi:hypothetical protein
MAAIVGTAVSNLDLAKNTAAEVTYTAATNDGTLVTDTETFYVTPDKRDGEQLILINNASGATVTCALLGGDFWFNSADMTGFTVATGKVYALTVDTAKYLQDTGKLHLKVTPTSGTALNATSKVNITAVQL